MIPKVPDQVYELQGREEWFFGVIFFCRVCIVFKGVWEMKVGYTEGVLLR